MNLHGFYQKKFWSAITHNLYGVKEMFTVVNLAVVTICVEFILFSLERRFFQFNWQGKNVIFLKEYNYSNLILNF